MKKTFAILTLLLLTLTASAQKSDFDIWGRHTNPRTAYYPLLTLDTLQEASTLSDLNVRYPASWVKKYLSVTISTKCGEQIQSESGPNDNLTAAQLKLLHTAQKDCRIDVEVQYIPENTLKDNPARKIAFSLSPIPIREARFPGGRKALKTYLQEQTMDKLSAESRESVSRAKVCFAVDEAGKVGEVRVLQSSEDPAVDALLLQAFKAMPAWQAASDQNGNKISQEFEFIMGTDLLRCDFVW